MLGAEVLHVGLGHKSVADALELDAGLGAKDAFHQVGGAHLETEEGGGDFVGQAGVLSDVCGEGAFAHARPGGDDDELRGLEAGGHAVEIEETGGDADGLAALLIRLLDPVGGFADGGGAVLQAGLFRVEAEVEEAFLAGVEDLVGRALKVSGLEHELDADAVDLAAAPVVAELVGPMTDGGGGAFGAGVFGGDEAGAALDLLELAGLAESFGEGEQVDGLTLGAEGLEDLPGGRVDRGEEPVVVHEFHGGVEGGGAAVEDAADQAGFGGLGPKGDGVGLGIHESGGRFDGRRVSISRSSCRIFSRRSREMVMR